MDPLALQSKLAQRRAIIEGFERHICCYFCGKEVVKLSGQDSESLAIHSLDGDHENWDPSNKVPTHQGCHTRHHDLERPSGPEHPRWKGGMEATLERTRDQRSERSRGQRRHRLHGIEIPAVLRGLELFLRELLKTESDLEGATIAFRAFYRLLEHRVGRPNYPEPVTWDIVAEWIHLYEMRRLDGGP